MMIAGQGISGSPDPMKEIAALRSKLGATTSRMQMAHEERCRLQEEVERLRARILGGQDLDALRQERDEARKAAQASAAEVERLDAIVQASESMSEAATGEIERLRAEMARLEARGRKRR